jgi:hypothetical protein
MTDQQRDIILALDPSSTICGYAALRRNRSILELGLITPVSRNDPSFDRVISMGKDLVTLLDLLKPGIILIEWTKGKVGLRRHGGQGAGLAVYGAGVGWLGCTAWHWALSRPRCELIPILENTWTRGVPKEARQEAMRSLVVEYGGVADPGGDIADALGLALWWLKEESLRLC